MWRYKFDATRRPVATNPPQPSSRHVSEASKQPFMRRRPAFGFQCSQPLVLASFPVLLALFAFLLQARAQTEHSEADESSSRCLLTPRPQLQSSQELRHLDLRAAAQGAARLPGYGGRCDSCCAVPRGCRSRLALTPAWAQRRARGAGRRQLGRSRGVWRGVAGGAGAGGGGFAGARARSQGHTRAWEYVAGAWRQGSPARAVASLSAPLPDPDFHNHGGRAGAHHPVVSLPPRYRGGRASLGPRPGQGALL